jgi:hypothetical protein
VKEDRVMKWLLVAMMAASMADLATTEMILARGITSDGRQAYEANPLIRNRAVRTSVKLAGPVFIYWATRKLSRKRRIFWCLAATTVWSVAAGHNIRVMVTHTW